MLHFSYDKTLGNLKSIKKSKKISDLLNKEREKIQKDFKKKKIRASITNMSYNNLNFTEDHSIDFPTNPNETTEHSPKLAVIDSEQSQTFSYNKKKFSIHNSYFNKYTNNKNQTENYSHGQGAILSYVPNHYLQRMSLKTRDLCKRINKTNRTLEESRGKISSKNESRPAYTASRKSGREKKDDKNIFIKDKFDHKVNMFSPTHHNLKHKVSSQTN